MKKSFLIIVLFFAFTSFSDIVHNCLGASSIMRNSNSKYEYTAKDYIQNGLIALYDGIENVNWGIHDNNANEWKDLVEISGNAKKNGNPIWDESSGITSGMENNFIVRVSNNSALVNSMKYGNFSVEICFSHSYSSFNARSLFAIEDSNGNSSTYRIL